MNEIKTDFEDRYKTTRQAAAMGGEVLRVYFGERLEESRKSDDSIVTKADLAAEAEVLRQIRKEFPNDLILAEESGALGVREPGKWIWVIDPLDGTSNFYYGLSYFCCSVGCGKIQENGSIDIQFGAVAAPLQEKLFHAGIGQGSYCNERRLSVSSTKGRPFEHLFMSMGLYYGTGDRLERELRLNQEITRRCQSIRRLGAAALELCMVAEGVFDGYWQEGLQPWDVAAASLIIKEAGGRVSTYRGNAPFDIEDSSILAGSSDVVDRLRELI